MPKELLLNSFHMNSPGHQSCGLWRHPRDRSHDYCSIDYWLQLARTLERGLFDGIFLADVAGVYDVYEGQPDAALRNAVQIPVNDPFLLVPAMATVTRHLGFGVTGSIPYEPPYAFARKISSLDHLTRGRMSWNVVTGYLDSAARGLGKSTQPKHDTRYEIAAEYMELMYKLWEGSWAGDALRHNKAEGVFTEPSRVHKVTHHGDYFDLEAIHLCEPSPQRSPVIFQAGSSPKGQAFAARHAECVFIGGNSAGSMRRTVDNLRRLATEAGRAATDLKVFGLLCVITDETDRLAQEKHRDYASYASAEGALALMSGWSGQDLSRYAPEDQAQVIETEAIRAAAQAGGSRTVGEWAQATALGGAAAVIAGSGASVARQMQEWAEQSGVDGFNLAYTVMPECVDDFVDLVVPQLQERGAFKQNYREGTMREKLFGRAALLADPHPGARFRNAQSNS